jgi:hypothetical protein
MMHDKRHISAQMKLNKLKKDKYNFPSPKN